MNGDFHFDKLCYGTYTVTATGCSFADQEQMLTVLSERRRFSAFRVMRIAAQNQSVTVSAEAAPGQIRIGDANYPASELEQTVQPDTRR